VLRVLANYEGQPPTDANLRRDLGRIAHHLNQTLGLRPPIDLARTRDRNLIRNSGQYWKGTGLLSLDPGVIRLTQLGRLVASGQVTRDDFAAIMVQQTVLPNPWTYTAAEVARWRAANLEIHPLSLILQVMEHLGRSHGGLNAAHVSAWELIRIVIPLAGTRANAAEIADAVARHRVGRLDVRSWPDCAPAANDHRLAKEFLRFLANFNLCQRVRGATTWEDRYYLDELREGVALVLPPAAPSLFDPHANMDDVVDSARDSSLPSIIERQRVTTTVLARPNQAKFRSVVLRAYGNRCLLTGDSMGEILEAAHIVPVEYNGTDTTENGICLRVDIHRLFDSSNIRILRTGQLIFSEALRASPNYHALPPRVAIPRFVNVANIEWRDSYI
jgi:hypothetical protein